MAIAVGRKEKVQPNKKTKKTRHRPKIEGGLLRQGKHARARDTSRVAVAQPARCRPPPPPPPKPGCSQCFKNNTPLDDTSRSSAAICASRCKHRRSRLHGTAPKSRAREAGPRVLVRPGRHGRRHGRGRSLDGDRTANAEGPLLRGSRLGKTAQRPAGGSRGGALSKAEFKSFGAPIFRVSAGKDISIRCRAQ